MIRIKQIEINRWQDGRHERYDVDGGCCLFMFIKTRAVLGAEGSETAVEPNTMILLDVNSPLYSHSYRGEYIDDCMIFESDEAIRLPVNKPVYIGNAVDISGHMRLIYEAHIRGDDIACCLLINAMFSQVAGIIAKSESSGMPHADKLIPLRYDMYAHPERDWNIKSMSEILYVSETYFQELYRNMFGISCGADIINARVKYAMSLLSETGKPITETARLCGYNSPAHFARQFKSVTGYTPTEYRRKKRTFGEL